MKNRLLLATFLLLFGAGAVWAQDIPKSQVPSNILKKFQQSFPKAKDVEWEMDGANYKVDFEIGLVRKDHSVWYAEKGTQLKHKERVAKSTLPKAVTTKIAADFNGYTVKDVNKITEGRGVKYQVELDSKTQDWKVIFNPNGSVLSKVAD